MLSSVADQRIFFCLKRCAHKSAGFSLEKHVCFRLNWSLHHFSWFNFLAYCLYERSWKRAVFNDIYVMIVINFKNNYGLFNIINIVFANYNDKDWFFIGNVFTNLVDCSNLSKWDTSNADMVWQQNAMLLLRYELGPAWLHLIFDQNRVQSFDCGLFRLELI